MSPYLQHTLSAPVQFAGVGVHSGQPVIVTLSPGPVDTGVLFVRADVGGDKARVPARADRVIETRLGTVIGNEAGVTVSTVEHLMAAFCGLGVDNVVVTINGPECPIMDGSCEPFVRLIDRAGRSRRAAAISRFSSRSRRPTATSGPPFSRPTASNCPSRSPSTPPRSAARGST